MNSEDKFKELLNEKLNSKEFPFNAENWEKARQMIDAEQSGKRRLVPFIFYLVGIFTLGGLTFYFLNRTNLKPEKTKAAQNTNKITEKPAIGSNLKQNSQTSNNDKNTNNASELTNQKSLPRANKNESSTIEKRSDYNDANTTINTNDGVVANDAPHLIETQKSNATVTMKKVKRSKAIVGSNTNNVGKEMPEENSTTHSYSPESTIKARADVKSKRRSKNSVIPETHQQNDKSTLTLNEDLKNKIGIDEKSASLLDTNIVQVPTKPENTVSNNGVDLEIKKDSTSTLSKAIDSSVTQKKSIDSVQTKPEKVEVPGLIFKDFISAEAGFAYNNGWKNNGSKDANGINLILGLNYARDVSKDLKLSLGIHYTSINNLSNFSRMSKQSSYSFGESSKVTVITPNKIHYLLLPFKIIYVMDQNNFVGVGYTFAYLITVKSKVENYTQSINTRTETSVTNTTGYTKGFKPFDSQVAVFYRRKIRSNLYANVEMFFGLTDIKDNTFFFFF